MVERPDTDQLTETLVPAGPLTAWLTAEVEPGRDLSVRRVTTGHSNEMFVVSWAGHEWVLRRPPRVANAPGAHDMAREFRLLRALEGTAVPHAEPVALCEDPAVIGAPFYLMAKVDGVQLYDALPEEFDNATSRNAIAVTLFETLGLLHRVDWEAAGLSGFGRPETFTERQVSRWMRQLDSYRVRDLPDLDEAAAWLQAHTPVMQRAALIHGDYGLHNVLYDRRVPSSLVAVVDWETATVGDPLIDIGYLLSLWLEDGEEDRWFAAALPYDRAGYPGRAEMAERYASAAGLDMTEIAWYRAVAQLKVACILEGGYARYIGGFSDDPKLGEYERIVPNHAAYALAITKGIA